MLAAMELSEVQRQAIIDGIRQHFGFTLLEYTSARNDALPHPHVSMHGLDPFENEPDAEERWEQELAAVRCWVLSQGWQLSRRILDGSAFNLSHDPRHEYLAPQLPVALPPVVYHATAHGPAILREGLLPSGSGAAIPKRPDCVGNLYFCATLGDPADVGHERRGSAHCWRGILARDQRSDPAGWYVLAVQLVEVPAVAAFRDVWSDTGIIVAGVAVPANLIQQVWP